MQFWAPQYEKDIILLVCLEEGDQDSKRSRGQDLQGVAEVTCLFSLEKRRLMGALITVYNILKEESGGGGDADLSLVTSNRTQRNGMKLHGEDGWSLEQVSHGNGHGTKPVGVQGASG